MIAAIPIDDPADPRIAAYRDIRERDLVGRQGQFIAEGEVVLAMLVRSKRHRAASLLIDAKRVESLGPLLTQLAPDVPVFAATQAVIGAIAGFPLHRGILAHGIAAPPLAPEQLLGDAPADAVIVALSAIANHDNMGGIFRNAAAFGAAGVLLDADCCDPLYRKAIRVSVGTSLTLPFARLPRGADMVALLAAAGFRMLALSPSGATDLHDVPRGGRVALMLGAEGPGLAEALMERAETVRIRMAEGVDSLNVATTSGIVLHHLTAGRD
ncbi:MAG TPA: RNA methyltransferase [Kaistia sp.]|nr:RNA methyltransferase [Kaistia sp.]